MLFTPVELNNMVGSFMWPFMRIGGALMAAPVFGTRLVPVKVRISLTLALTLMVLPILPPVSDIDIVSVTGLLVSLQQLMIGVTMGFLLQLVFNALIIAGESMAMSMGLGFASMVDPQHGVSVPVISQLFVIVATLVFLALNGHITLLRIIVESFQTLPVSQVGIPHDGFWTIVNWAGFMFAAAVQVALPVVTALMIAYLALGVMTRAAPQLNIFSVGFPITILVGFLVLMLTMPSLLPIFSYLLQNTFELMQELLGF